MQQQPYVSGMGPSISPSFYFSLKVKVVDFVGVFTIFQLYTNWKTAENKLEKNGVKMEGEKLGKFQWFHHSKFQNLLKKKKEEKKKKNLKKKSPQIFQSEKFWNKKTMAFLNSSICLNQFQCYPVSLET